VKPQATTIDLQALPAALLPLAKAQARVDHNDDDIYVKAVLARAIAHLENEWNIRINPATIEWTPDSSDFCSGQAKVPVRPIASMTATATAGDVSAAYALSLQGLFGAAPYLIVGDWQDGLAFQFQCGYSASTLPPGIENEIMLQMTHRYEHREIFMDRDPGAVPTPAIDSSTPWWVPRA
jgi:hypothetical protein